MKRWDKRNFPIKVAVHEETPDWVMSETEKVLDQYNDLFQDLNILTQDQQVFELLPNKTTDFIYGDGMVTVAFMTLSDAADQDVLGSTWVLSNPETGEIGDADILIQLDPIVEHHNEYQHLSIETIYYATFGHELGHVLGIMHNNYSMKYPQENYNTLFLSDAGSKEPHVNQWFLDEYPYDYDRMLIRYGYDDTFVFEDHAFNADGSPRYQLIRE